MTQIAFIGLGNMEEAVNEVFEDGGIVFEEGGDLFPCFSLVSFNHRLFVF